MPKFASSSRRDADDHGPTNGVTAPVHFPALMHVPQTLTPDDPQTFAVVVGAVPPVPISVPAPYVKSVLLLIANELDVVFVESIA